MKYKLYEGFGLRMKAGTWAETAGVPLRTFHYYLAQGMTIEEIFKQRGVEFDPLRIPSKKARKQRGSIIMSRTQQTIYYLMLMSGYVEPDDQMEYCVHVDYQKGGYHRITFKDEILGRYNYKTGGLILAGKNRAVMLNDDDILEDNIKIRKDRNGFWEPTPQTAQYMHNLTLNKVR